jgi:hypothetical protein
MGSGASLNGLARGSAGIRGAPNQSVKRRGRRARRRPGSGRSRGRRSSAHQGLFRENLRMEDVKSSGSGRSSDRGPAGLHAGPRLSRGTRRGPDVDAHELAVGVENEGLHLLRTRTDRVGPHLLSLRPKHQMPELGAPRRARRDRHRPTGWAGSPERAGANTASGRTSGDRAAAEEPRWLLEGNARR